jgi:hypothetical protein
MTIHETLKYDQGKIDPDAYGVGTVNGAWVPMANFTEGAAIFMVGLMGAGSTLTAKIQQAQALNGVGSKDLPAKSTSLDQASGDGDEIATVSFRASELDTANDYNHVRISVAAGVATVDYAGVLVRAGAGTLPQINT